MSETAKYNLDFNRPEKIFFVGIGGISMSGLAMILADAGFEISGSDRDRSDATEKLEKRELKSFTDRRERISRPI